MLLALGQGIQWKLLTNAITDERGKRRSKHLLSDRYINDYDKTEIVGQNYKIKQLLLDM